MHFLHQLLDLVFSDHHHIYDSYNLKGTDVKAFRDLVGIGLLLTSSWYPTRILESHSATMHSVVTDNL